jgi:curved DNA-binding protein CbpA
LLTQINQDHYAVLNIKPGATLKEIKEAYTKLAFLYHPDRNQTNEDATSMMQSINEAYAILSNPAKRKEYDLPLGYSVLQPKYKIGSRVKVNSHSNTPFRDHVGLVEKAPMRDNLRYWYLVRFASNGMDIVNRFAEDELNDDST